MTDTDTLEEISGLDDLFYDVTLTDASTGTALTPALAPTVTMMLCRLGTTTPLSPTASQVLTFQSAGRWTGIHDDANVLAALSTIAVGHRFDRVLQVGTLAVRRMATCRRVAILDAA